MEKTLFMFLMLISNAAKNSCSSLDEYLVSIKSLRFKNEEMQMEIKKEALKDPQNLLAIKIWLKKKRPGLPNNQVACAPIASIWTDTEVFSYNAFPIQISFSSDKLYYCDSRKIDQNEKLSNIYKTKLVFANEEYMIKKQLGSGRVEKVRIEYSCNKDTFINNICFGFNEFKFNTKETKSFCMNMDIISHCFTAGYSRTNYSEHQSYNLVLTNLFDIQRGLELIDNKSYNYHIDLICDNIELELTNSSPQCFCDADEWNKQVKSNINVFFVGFEAETKSIMIDPAKCNKIAN